MRRSGRGLFTGLVLLAIVASSLQTTQVFAAAQITARTLTLQAGAGGDGGSKPNGVVNHVFTFTVPTQANVGSIKFEYCMIAVGVCDMPVGLVTTAATSGTQAGATGFTLDNTTNGVPFFTRTAAQINSGTAVTLPINGVTNPTATNKSFFVRISTYTSIDTTGTPIDSGVVTASTANQIVLTGIMPESIIFCTGATITKTSGVPDCSTATSGVIDFNQLFSPSDTATATSQMAASTNSANGYIITVNGPTLTSGANTIPAMAVAAAGVKGTGQFGMNLKANTTTTSTVAIGAELDPTSASDPTNLKGVPSAGYEVPDVFKFASGDPVATSTAGGAGPTNAQIYTSSYIVNVAGNQLSGTYTTTLTYICTATF